MAPSFKTMNCSQMTTVLFSYYGINVRTKLLGAPFFDPCGQLVEDVMHIFLEGVLAYEMKLLLNYYINDIKAFGLSDLNNRIQQFCYGYSNSKNRPSLILERDLEKNSFHESWTECFSNVVTINCVALHFG